MENACFGQTDTWNMLNYDNVTCVDANWEPLSTLSANGALVGTLEANALSLACVGLNGPSWMPWGHGALSLGWIRIIIREYELF